MKNDNKYISIAIYSLAVITAGTVLIMLILGLRDFLVNRTYTTLFDILNPFIYGAVFAYLLNPLMNLFEKRIYRKLQRRKKDARSSFRLRRYLSLASALIIALVVISLILLMVSPQIGASINQLAANVTDLFSPAEGAPITGNDSTFLQDTDWDALFTDGDLTAYNALMNTKLGVYISGWAATAQRIVSDFGFEVDIEYTLRVLFLSATAELTRLITDSYQQIINTTAGFIISTARHLLNILIGLIITVYILAEKEHLASQLKRVMYAVFPTGVVHKTIEITRKTHRIFNNFISGKVLDSLIIGVLCFICMSLFRINFPMLISVIVGITNIIPFFGPFIGAIPSFIFLALSDFGQGVWFLFFILILQQIDGNIIGPKILGSSIGISAFWVIFAILVMSGLLGPVGMFIGVPLFAVIYTLVKDFSTSRLVKKGLQSVCEAEGIDAGDAPYIITDENPVTNRFSGLVESWSAGIQGVINKMRGKSSAVHDEDKEDIFKRR